MSARAAAVPPRLSEQRPGRRWGWALALALVAGGLAWLYWFDPARGGFYPVCYFHQTTGWLCPGCGGLRAVHELLHGRLASALYFNPLFVLSLPLAAWLGGWYALNAWRGRSVPFVVRPAWLWCGGALVLAFSILRNLPWPHLGWLGLHP